MGNNVPTQKSRWDDQGVEPPAGEARYQAGEQPIAEYDNWFNKAIVDDIAAIITFLRNLGLTKIYQDLEENKPASGKTTELFIATDTNKIYRGTGSGWQELTVDWNKILNKPSTYPPSAHQHDASEVSSGVLDLARIPTIPRTKLEYPTEDVSFAYLTAINKAKHTQPLGTLYYPTVVTLDSFTDKAIGYAALGEKIAGHLRISKDEFYADYIDTTKLTADHKLIKQQGDNITDLATEAVDLDPNRSYFIVFQSVGSTLKAWRHVLLKDISTTSATITATDTDLPAGLIGAAHSWGAGGLETHIYEPFSQVKQAQAIIEVEIIGSGDPENPIRPDLAQLLDKHPQFGNIDKLSVTWGVFDHKPEHNTMLIIITGGNAYTGEKAILEQIEHAKSKNLKVLKPPRDYSEAIEQYRQLKQEFTEWIAGKDNFVYQTLGHEDFEKFQVADTYHGNIVEGYKPDAYKNVPDWEMRRTLAMWKERLKRAEVAKLEAERHLKKLEEVEKKGW